MLILISFMFAAFVIILIAARTIYKENCKSVLKGGILYKDGCDSCSTSIEVINAIKDSEKVAKYIYGKKPEVSFPVCGKFWKFVLLKYNNGITICVGLTKKHKINKATSVYACLREMALISQKSDILLMVMASADHEKDLKNYEFCLRGDQASVLLDSIYKTHLGSSFYDVQD